MFVDSHIHLTHHLFDGNVPCIDSSKNEDRIGYFNREKLIDEFHKNKIAFCIEPGINLESNKKLLELSERYPQFVYPAIGIHPTRTAQTEWKCRSDIESLSANEKVVAIGELGLDYHQERIKQHRIRQKIWFIWQIRLAHRRKLPLVLHIRSAHKDAVKILRWYKRYIHGGVCHCFNGGEEYAKIYTEEFGFMLGIGGALLQEECSELEKAVAVTPLENIILETDGPFVGPAKPDQYSGKKWKKARNTSLIIPDVAAKVAALKGIEISEVERVTTQNVIRVFNIDLSDIQIESL